MGGRSGRDIRKTIVEALITRSTNPEVPLSREDIVRVFRETEHLDGSDSA